MQIISNNKTVFCLLIITLFTVFFFARSVVVRGRWIVPTFLMSQSPHQNGAAQHLAFANSWLKENPLKLRFINYYYPESVETPTLDKRGFYGSFPPGSTIPVYILLKTLDSTGIVSNIYERRGIQLLLLILLNYITHLSIALVTCWMVFFIFRKARFDNLNSTLLAIIPAIVQFNNSNSLYWHHISYYHDTVIILPFVTYIFLEILRIIHTSSRVSFTAKVLQPLLMFYGVLTSWFFVFVILTIYAMRTIRKEISLPVSLQQGMCWVKQSFYFFAPALVAVTIWLYQLTYYVQNVAHSAMYETVTSGHGLTLIDNIVYRLGITGGVDRIFFYLKTQLFTQMYDGYGMSGLLILWVVFYMATRGYKFTGEKDRVPHLLASMYLMLFIPCFVQSLVFMQAYADHKFASLRFSPALSISFAFAPVFILQMMRKEPMMSAIYLMRKESVTVVALLGLGSSVLYGYVQLYDKSPVTKLFSPPAYHHVVVGNFVRTNTEYRDVVFSKDYYLPERFSFIEAHFSYKRIYFANNLDHLYHKIKEIEEGFTIKIFYFEGRKPSYLSRLPISVDDIQKKRLGGLLSFDGKKFLAWYERSHECDLHPQRCMKED